MSFSGPKQLIGTRLSPTSIRFNWWPAPGGADKQFIMYGLESGKPQWGLINIAGGEGQIVVDHLPANTTIWAQIRAYKGNCYEDTDWVSVASSKQAAAPQLTAFPTPTITVQPTGISMNSTAFTPSPTPVIPQEESPSLFLAIWNNPGMLALLAILLALAVMLRKYLFLIIYKKKKKKEDS